ncbi:MAG: GatB/YqeY domain-containing protein [Anaerolineae bacterium]
MMNLHERLASDLNDAMRAKDSLRKDAIRMVRAALQNAEIEVQHPLSESEVQQLISRDIKHREESILLLRKANRHELVQIEEASIQILQSYLPRQLSSEQIEQVVHDIVARSGLSGSGQFSAVMREAMAQLKGQADGRIVSEIVRKVLSN